jgi:hypothetical protein
MTSSLRASGRDKFGRKISGLDVGKTAALARDALALRVITANGVSDGVPCGKLHLVRDPDG